MSEKMPIVSNHLIELTAKIVMAFTSHNQCRSSDLHDIICGVHHAIKGLTEYKKETPEMEIAFNKPTTTQIRKSIRPDGIVSFIDGKSYKSLRRHLRSHGYDPESYRDRYGLPYGYPMTSENYSAMRSELAKSAGFGGRSSKR